jgi:CO dehydrogenase nickel-insertion accessory protein CooC1
LIAWIKKNTKEQQEKWENSTKTMKERKPHHKTMTRRESRSNLVTYVLLDILRSHPFPECSFCAVNITIDHILWHCKETETKRLQIDTAKEIWKGGRQEMKKLITYVKVIELFDRI